ncbi:hypothetical protein KIL84_001925 [Mauremys mutica]|uniref:Uncharacterized protein n=1 Tax=Mauremys mutica TaxID=74926 RepID=A0A9D4B568_9SAUR|nr:hypothetical protein KIL84_001925 [Mauremys mutica]
MTGRRSQQSSRKAKRRRPEQAGGKRPVLGVRKLPPVLGEAGLRDSIVNGSSRLQQPAGPPNSPGRLGQNGATRFGSWGSENSRLSVCPMAGQPLCRPLWRNESRLSAVAVPPGAGRRCILLLSAGRHGK